MNKNLLSYFFLYITGFFAATLGRFNWTSPPWMKYLGHQARTRPVVFWSSMFGILLFIVTTYSGYSWYKNRPQLPRVVANITIPKVTSIQDDELIPDVLTLNFGLTNPDDVNNLISQSVAPLKLIGKPVEHGIVMKPAVEGEWVWQSDSQLVFTPKNDWPAGQTYTIYFDKEAFAADVKMQTYTESFSTLPFEGKIKNFVFYQDPVNPKNRQATATIEFNFPVNPESLEANTSLMLQALQQGQLNLHAHQYKFNYTYDKFKRTAYLHSEVLSVPDVSRYLLLTIRDGIKSETGSDRTHLSITQNLLIPDVDNYFKLLSATSSIIRNDQDRPEQVLVLESSIGVTETEVKKSLHVYLLPENYPATASEAEKPAYEWQNPSEVTDAILALSTPVKLHVIPADNNYATLHSFKYMAQSPRYLFVKLDKGMQGFGGFSLTHEYGAVIKVPELPKEISFLHKGALLAFSGEKKLSVLIRGLAAVKFDFSRVLPENINQLVTQTQGDFNNPTFINKSFNQQNISELFSEVQQFDASDLTLQRYTAVDFSKYLAAATNTLGPQGLFLLQARAWDAEKNMPLDTQASRLVLITDLGLVVKDNQDGTHDVFVQSITEGTPREGVGVSILGKNGLPLLTFVTDVQGRVTFPVLTSYIDEREPVVYLANLENDISFIPYNNANRQLNFSRFDIGGIYNNPDQHSLSAYLFTDRGMYRPGDTAQIGMIIKQPYAAPQAPGLPLQATVINPRGTTILDQKFTLDPLGYFNFSLPTTDTSPTGQYQINLYTVKDQHTGSLLGSTTLTMADFQPDRMRIKSNLSPAQDVGWVSPTDLVANIQLWNLYGAPATDRRVSAKILLEPKPVEFKEFPDYRFVDPLIDPKKPAKVFTESLSEAKTDAKGEASFKLNLERFDKATYQLTFFAEGFEAEGGRSVVTQSTALVSPLAYLIGYKPDSDLSFIKQNSEHVIRFIAINPQLKLQSANDLNIELATLTPVSTLVKRPDGTFQYQSIIQTKVISKKPFVIGETGANFVVPTQEIGDLSVTITDKANTVLSRVNFSVVGASQRPLAKNAELDVKLNKEIYNPGDDIELQITAPYTGAGLITIERDKVYATRWFKTSTISSVQKIHIPNDFQGNGYINVTFVRDWSSPDIFISPLSYSVVPFEMDHDDRAVHIDLKTPKLARPGEPFIMEYVSDKPGKVIVFAVDEGILQVARYETPDPLAFFFQKHALEVLTQQTVDQILPQYIKERELSAVGGDASAAMLMAHLNPFKRKTDLPVVYWSGIVDTDAIPRQLTFDIPDYFNGSLHVMAVAVALDSVGAADKTTEVRGHFVISPNTPTFVAPGDEFEISASIANNVKDSGPKANVAVQLNISPGLEVLGSDKTSLIISEGQEKTVHFKLRAHAKLGSASINLVASIGDQSSSMDSTLSIRPASPFTTTVTSGRSKTMAQSLAVDRSLYPEYRKVEAAISSSPLILVSGLQQYLDNFPYGCTEQLISKAFPLLVMADQPWFMSDAQIINQKIMATLQMLSQRQMSNGGFSYWPGMGENAGNAWASVYAMHFLTDAKIQAYVVPNELFNAGINYLKELAAQNPTDLDHARIQAYAIYILTRNEIVTTNYLTNLQLYLDKEQAQVWKTELTGAYIAATYQLLKNQTEANQLIGQFKLQTQPPVMFYFYDSNIANAQYLYLLARHFPEQLPALGDAVVMQLVAAMNRGEVNTLLSSYTSLALSAYAKANQPVQPSEFSINELLADQQKKTLSTFDNVYGKANLAESATQVLFGNPKQVPYFYQLTQAGFDKIAPEKAIQQGLEITREYRDLDGKTIDTTTLGTEIEVHIQVRALNNQFISNAAIVDLLPGGFEIVRNSMKQDMEYADVREDRVIFFGSIDASAREIVYRMKATNIGQYTIPPILAESMYDPTTKARGIVGLITVTK